MRNPNARVSDPQEFVTSSGSDIHILYSGKLMPNGEIKLSECGKESISDKIQAQVPFTDINYIINRLTMGDTSVLRDGAMYGDFTEVPKSLAEALEVIINGQKKFDELPVEIKNKFDNNYYAWIQQAGSIPWMEKMNIPIKKIVEEEKESDKVNES